jgi:drug/metabolite transporter (DMT)-like permease
LVLLIGTVLGTSLNTLQWNAGAWLIVVSTVLFAIDFVIAKHLLEGLATLTVMTARMTLGTAMLFVYIIASGRLAPVSQLGAGQWAFVVITGLLLLLFTTATFTAIRHASVSAVMAIGSGAPVITTALQFVLDRDVRLSPADLVGLLVTVLAVVVIIGIGVRQESLVHAHALEPT